MSVETGPSLLGPLAGPWQRLKRGWLLYHLANEQYRFMFDPPPPDEWVALDCETTGLDVRRDEIISIGAVRIAGNRIMTSERLELIVRPEKRKLSADSVKRSSVKPKTKWFKESKTIV